MLLCVPWSTRAKDNTRNQPKTLKCLHQSWPLCLGLVSLGSEPGWWIFVCGPHVPSENPQASEWTGTARGFGYSRWIWNQVQKLSFKLNGTAVSIYSQFLKLQREERLGWDRWVESRSQRTHFPYACESWSPDPGAESQGLRGLWFVRSRLQSTSWLASHNDPL